MDEVYFNAKFLKTYKFGEVVFREGDAGGCMYVINSGVIDIVKNIAGVDTVVTSLGKGDIFGEMALIDSLPRSAMAVSASDDTSLLEVDHAHFVYLVGQQPAFALIILKALSMRLRSKVVDQGVSESPGPGPRSSGRGNGEIVEVRENIFQLRGKCMAYLIKGRRKNLLIDTGVPGDADQLRDQLSRLGLDTNDVNMLVLTHEHMDHIGCATIFGNSTVVAAHVMAANKVGMQDEFVLMSEGCKLDPESYHIDIRLHHGTSIDIGGFVLQVLHSPGHSSGSICLYEPELQILFTGDTIFANGVLGGIFPSGSISDYALTLKDLSKLQVKELYPGHGKISLNPKEDFAKAIKGAVSLANDTRTLFGALDSHAEFTQVYKAISTYSRRI